MNGAETARIQGVDPYREQATRIVACMENAPRCTRTARSPRANRMTERGIPWRIPWFVVEPTWEIEYKDYTNRHGLGMPRTSQLVHRYRSRALDEWVRATHHIALEMLARADVGNLDLEDVPASRGGP